MKPIKLKLLVLEDEANDAELEISELKQAGYDCEWKRVETREEFMACLETPDYDLILSDYALPSFDGLTALCLLQECKVDIPFILVSGTLGEDAAIDSLKAGAVDYVMKTRISRLGPVVKRALKEQLELRQRQQMQRELQAVNERFRAIVENAPDAIISMNHRGTVVGWNPAAQTLFGYTADEMLACEVDRIIPANDRPNLPDRLQNIVSGQEPKLVGKTIELVGQRKDGRTFPIELSLATWSIAHEQLFTAIIRDSTERKQAEKTLKQHNAELQQFNKMTTDRELRMIELKKEINALNRELGREEPYG